MDALYGFDLTGFRAINIGLHEPWLDPFFLVLTYTGLAQVEVAAALLLLIRKATRRYVLPLLIVMLVGGLAAAQGTKHLLERDRPSNLIWSHPEEAWRYNSFPSGHTTMAFSCAFLILLMNWGTSRAKWGWIAVGWAALVGVSRIYRGVHWPTDVLGGMFCGLVAASLVYLLVGNRNDPEPA